MIQLKLCYTRKGEPVYAMNRAIAEDEPITILDMREMIPQGYELISYEFYRLGLGV